MVRARFAAAAACATLCAALTGCPVATFTITPDEIELGPEGPFTAEITLAFSNGQTIPWSAMDSRT